MAAFQKTLDGIQQYSPNAKVFCLLHKMGLVEKRADRDSLFKEYSHELAKMTAPAGFQLRCFQTSIWDETLFKAWSAMVCSIVPNVDKIETGLTTLCQLSVADEIVLFEKATFLVIGKTTVRDFDDVHRYENISNIVKQFKLRCHQACSKFYDITVSNSKFSVFIGSFTQNAYIMVITTNPKIHIE